MANRYDVLKKMYLREAITDIENSPMVPGETDSSGAGAPATTLDKPGMIDSLKIWIEDAYEKFEKLVTIERLADKMGQAWYNLETFFRLVFENAKDLFDIVVRNISSLPNAVKQNNFWQIVKDNFGEVGSKIEKVVLDAQAQFETIMKDKAVYLHVGAALVGLGLVLIVYNYYQAQNVNLEGAKLLRAGRYPFKEAKVYKLGCAYLKEGFSGVGSMVDDFVNALKRTMLSFYDMFVKTVSDNKYATAGYVFIAIGCGAILYPVLTYDFNKGLDPIRAPVKVQVLSGSQLA